MSFLSFLAILSYSNYSHPLSFFSSPFPSSSTSSSPSFPSFFPLYLPSLILTFTSLSFIFPILLSYFISFPLLSHFLFPCSPFLYLLFPLFSTCFLSLLISSLLFHLLPFLSFLFLYLLSPLSSSPIPSSYPFSSPYLLISSSLYHPIISFLFLPSYPHSFFVISSFLLVLPVITPLSLSSPLSFIVCIFGHKSFAKKKDVYKRLNFLWTICRR